MSFFNVGIIGFGLSGRCFFAPFISVHPGFNLKAIVTSQKEETKRLYPDTIVLPTADDLFNLPEIDLIVVASPNSTHFEYAKRALLAGKHVVVEKPFTITSNDAKELTELSLLQNKLLAPFQNRRWDGDFLTVKKMIADNLLGEIVEFESHFDRYRPLYERVAWKNENVPGTGTLFDLGPHLIDQALCLFGTPNSIYADIRKLRTNGAIDDTFEIQMYYSQLKVILKAGVMVREPGPRFVVHGRNGSFVKYGLDGQEGNLKNGILPGNPLLGKDKVENYGLLHTEIDSEIVRKKVETIEGNYMGFFENIYRALCKKEELIVKPNDAKLIIEVIERAIQSNQQKRVLKF